jgi:predicted nucleic acid-binding protein
MIVIADSSPLRYLVLIEEIEVVSRLFGRILIPPAVIDELTRPKTPLPVRLWIESLPEWCTVRSPKLPMPHFPLALGSGECEAIALAEELGADGLLADDYAARVESASRGILVVGTLAILDLASEEGLLNLPSAMQKLMSTNFRAHRELVEFYLERDRVRRKTG